MPVARASRHTRAPLRVNFLRAHCGAEFIAVPSFEPGEVLHLHAESMGYYHAGQNALRGKRARLREE